MLESLRPGNVLLAALAAWALGLLVLALSGLGANFGPHPDNPALAPPVPQVELSEVGARLGPLSAYDEVSRRPLLNADRRAADGADAAGGDAPMDLELTGVLMAGDFQAALLQSPDRQRSERVRVGELVAGTGWRLVSLAPRSADFEGPQGRRTLELRLYDGSADGAAAPAARPAAAAPAPEGAPAAAAATPPNADAPAGEDDQVQAIRRRIEARREQLREEAARRNAQKVE
ncbi:hypothetical protein [Arenimonas caeni]|uniref:hypothetical protein n=1 Tax=Arenimonas caeni TaxID=2058085 RepID=UPI002A36DA9C|nr:hypothetical protein [Arenimonas caeni]MDY0022076.1 hypothetical protein [Arenimonas caeni]